MSPERFELSTTELSVRHSTRLSYGLVGKRCVERSEGLREGLIKVFPICEWREIFIRG